MGNACCVAAARDKMVLVVPNSSAAETERRYSPTWSFRWDNNNNRGGGGRVAGEDSSLSWLSDGISRNDDGSHIKFESSSDASPMYSLHTQTLHKSPPSDLSFPINHSMDTVFEQKDNDSSYPSPHAQLSLSLASQPSSFQASKRPSESNLDASSPTPQLTQRPRLSKQVSDCQIYGMNSLSRSSPTEERLGTSLKYDSSQSRPSEGWSRQAFSEIQSSSRCNEPLSYDNHCFGLERDKIDDHHGKLMSNHHQQLTCGACSRPLSEKSLWSSQKMFMTNELSVSAILACGHVYHGECLEQMTPEVDKFDPSCPICTLGEKKTTKLSEKALKVEMNLKAKRLRNRVLDSDFDCDDFVMNDHSHMAATAESPELVSSSSVKSYSAKPFLAQHFSFGSRGKSKSAKENLPVKKKGFFWTKSSKI